MLKWLMLIWFCLSALLSTPCMAEFQNPVSGTGGLAWTQIGGPSVQLPSGDTPSYLAPLEGTVVIQLSIGAETISIANVQIAHKIQVESIYDYFPNKVELELAMQNRYLDLYNSDSPFLLRAASYNQLLVDSAFLVEEGRRLKRSVYYLNKMDKVIDISSEIYLVENAEKSLDDLYKTYGRLFVLKKMHFKQFDLDAISLTQQIYSASQQVIKKRSELQELARSLGKTWIVPPVPEEKPIIIAPDGKPNQIVFTTRSLLNHFELEEPLTISKIRSVNTWTPNRIDGVYDFGYVLAQREREKTAGVDATVIATQFGLKDVQMTPRWFRDAHASDPDIIMMAEDGAQIDWSDNSYQARWPLNIWRPEVRDMTIDMLTQFGQQFKNSPEFLWYVTAAENIGPYFETLEGNRSIGYNPSAIVAFQGWLEEQYLSIENLNQQWQTSYQAFEEIVPPEDQTILGADEWERPHPCGSEFQKWAIDSHFNWQKMIYDTLKQADPTTPIFTSHTRFLSTLDGSKMGETADIIGYHHAYPRFMNGVIYTYSINRFAKKQLGQYECFWGIQEDRPRMAEEKTQRHGMMKYLYRLTTWGRHIQTWWYSYTPNWYMTKYNGNWFNPTYDLTTLRYCTGSLPVGKAKVKRLEEIFMNSTIIPSRILILQPNASMLPSRHYGESYYEIEKLHNILFRHNIWYEIIPETYFEDGRASLDDFDVIILPRTLYFYDGFAAELDVWIKNGGFLLGLGPFGLYDKFGFDEPTLWNNIFGELPVRTERYWDKWYWIWSWIVSDENSLIEKTYGSGRVMTTLKTLIRGTYSASVENNIVAAIEAATPSPVICSLDFEPTIHESSDGKRYLCVINRNVDNRVTSLVSMLGEYAQGVDLDIPDGFPITFNIINGRTLFLLGLDPGEFTMIALE